MCYPAGVVRGRKNPGYLGFAARLKRARKSALFSRLGLMQHAAIAGRSTLHGWEQGQRLPRLDGVEKLAYALGLSPTFLAYGIEADGLPLADGLRCEEVAVRLQETRAARGLSVLALAKQAGLSHTAVGNIERGTMPGIDTAEALANALGVSPGWLAYGLGPMELPKRRTTRSAASTAPANAT